MALLGAIRPGTIAGLIRLLSQGDAVATLICERRNTRVDLYFSGGKIEGTELNLQPNEDALDILSEWSDGVYRLIKGRIERGYGRAGGGEDAGHVLFISKDPALTGTVDSTLEQAGYQVSAAHDPIQALETLEQVSPSLVIVDTEPGEGELAVARQIREAAAGKDLPIIALTRMPDAALARSLQAAGLSSLAKPITPEALVGSVSQEIQMLLMRSSRDWSALALPSEVPDLAPDAIDILLFDELIPPLDGIYNVTEKLGIRIALGEPSFETVALFDLFDGRHSLREIMAANPKLSKKLQFLATYMVSTGLLETVTPALPTQKVIDEETGEISEIPLPRLSSIVPRERPDQPYFNAADTIVLADTLHAEYGPQAQWAKMVSLGLPAAYRSAFADTLRFVSAVQAGFIKRGGSINVPSLPEYEIARMAMRSDLLMTVHDIEAESRLTELIKLLGGQIWGFVFFVSMHQRSAMTYLRSLVNSVTKQYPRPYVVNLLNVAPNVEGDAIQLVEDTLELETSGRVGVWSIQRPESVVEMISHMIQVSE